MSTKSPPEFIATEPAGAPSADAIIEDAEGSAASLAVATTEFAAPIRDRDASESTFTRVPRTMEDPILRAIAKQMRHRQGR